MRRTSALLGLACCWMLAGCSAKAAPVVQPREPRAIGIPADAKDEDWICVSDPQQPVAQCRRVGEVRGWIRSRRA